MKVRELIVLVRYGQGLIFFDPFFRYVKFLSPQKREQFLLEIIELIIKMRPLSTDGEDAVTDTGINNENIILKLRENQIDREILDDIVRAEIESAFRFLLNLFTIVYLREFAKHKNEGKRFWFWDFSDPLNLLKIGTLNTENSVDINNVF